MAPSFVLRLSKQLPGSRLSLNLYSVRVLICWQEGCHGLSATAKDYLAVLADLISDSPKLLKLETISQMFTPQLEAGSPAIEMLLQLRPAWDTVSGPVPGEMVNHGLGGLLILGEAPEIGQPKNILGWGGASNTIWFACRDLGVAGFFGTQLQPFGDPAAKELINAWKKDVWTIFNTTACDEIRRTCHNRTQSRDGKYL